MPRIRLTTCMRVAGTIHTTLAHFALATVRHGGTSISTGIPVRFSIEKAQ
jgi:hypothetical protein